MDKDTPYELENGDTFTLLVHEYPVKFVLEQQKELGMNCVFFFLNTWDNVKRKIEDDEDEVLKEFKTTKKQKVEDEKVPSDSESGDGRPLCPYGLECYRKNPGIPFSSLNLISKEHKKQYAHVDMKASTDTKTKTQNKKADNSSSSDGKFSLVFPSISTNTYQFDVNKAAQVACKVFLGKSILTIRSSPNFLWLIPTQIFALF